MIIDVRINNCFAFNDPVELNLEANLNDRSLLTNINEGPFNILKTAAIYGPNNTGKSNFIKSIKFFKSVLCDEKNTVIPNLFNNHPLVELGVTFLYESEKYSFDFKYDAETKEFVYERFDTFNKDEVKNIYLRDYEKKEYFCIDETLQQILPFASRGNIIIYTIDADNFYPLNKVKNILRGMAAKIDILEEKGFDEQTRHILKGQNEDLKKQVVEFIKHADIYLDNVVYKEERELELPKEMLENTNSDLLQDFRDRLKLMSTYRGKEVPSILFDSLGTNRFMALSSYIINAINEGRVLIIDEIDSSLHSRLTRAIVSLFNSTVNEMGQLIFTTHDTTLLDISRLFRKDQIWFTHKDLSSVYLYSLNQIVEEYGESMIEKTDDIARLYEKGMFLAIAQPDLLAVFLKTNCEGEEEE